MELAGRSDAEILEIVDPIMDNLMEGSTEIDHAKHTRDFTDRLKEIVTPGRLEEMCTDYQARIGYFTDRELIAVFRRASSVAVVWRQSSSKTDDEFIAQVVIVERNGQYFVDHALIV